MDRQIEDVNRSLQQALAAQLGWGLASDLSDSARQELAANGNAERPALPDTQAASNAPAAYPELATGRTAETQDAAGSGLAVLPDPVDMEGFEKERPIIDRGYEGLRHLEPSAWADVKPYLEFGETVLTGIQDLKKSVNGFIGAVGNAVEDPGGAFVDQAEPAMVCGEDPDCEAADELNRTARKNIGGNSDEAIEHNPKEYLKFEGKIMKNNDLEKEVKTAE